MEGFENNLGSHKGVCKIIETDGLKRKSLCLKLPVQIQEVLELKKETENLRFFTCYVYFWDMFRLGLLIIFNYRHRNTKCDIKVTFPY